MTAVKAKAAANTKAKAASRAEMHPVLYPILLLLARLRASDGAAEMEAEQNEVGGGRGACQVGSQFFRRRKIYGHRKDRSHRMGVNPSLCRCGVFPVWVRVHVRRVGRYVLCFGWNRNPGLLGVKDLF